MAVPFTWESLIPPSAALQPVEIGLKELPYERDADLQAVAAKDREAFFQLAVIPGMPDDDEIAGELEVFETPVCEPDCPECVEAQLERWAARSN